MTEVDLFIPCFIDQLYPQTAFNTIAVLEKAGCQVHYNPSQTCCGQPAYNAGYFKDARKVADKFLKDFDTGRPIVSPSASCIAMVQGGYQDLYKDTATKETAEQLANRAYEMSSFLVDVLQKDDFGAKLQGKATYHDSCSGLRECGLSEQPRRLLSYVEGLELVELPENTTCCGFGGTFAVKFEAISTGMAEQKVQHAISTGAEFLISSDVSCLLHLEAYITKHKLPIKTMHLADVLMAK